MNRSSKLDQILAYLPKAKHHSQIWVYEEEEEGGTWGVAVKERDTDEGNLWSDLQEDPTSHIKEYCDRNPDQHLRLITPDISEFPRR